MIYQEPEIDGIKTPILVIGETSAYYKLPFIINDNSITFPTVDNMNITFGTIENSNQRFYKLEGNNRFIVACKNFSSMIDLAQESINHNYLVFPNDGYSRRTMYEELEEAYYVFPFKKTIYYSQISNIAKNFTMPSRPKFSTQISTIKNSVCRVKLCKDCLFLRLQDSFNNIALTIKIYPFDSIGKEVNIDSTNTINWARVNINLDPFYLDGSIWVVFSFPYQTYIPSDFICLLFNASTGEKIKLVGDPLDTTWQGISTAFAIISIEDLSNQEIIALDTNGQIYVWDLLTNQYKFSTLIKNCANAQIGSIFQKNNRKWLVTACDDLVVRIYDFQTSSTIELTEIQLYSMPLALNAYSDPGIIIISDYNSGDAHIYKFDSVLNKFNFLMTLFKGKIKDNLIGIELIQQNEVLWIQYQNSNLFFELGQCIQNINNCLSCSQYFYFNTTETIDRDSQFGLGTNIHPFTGSNNYLTTMLKVQMYKDLIQIPEKISLILVVDSSNPFQIRQGFVDNDINSIISVNIIPIISESKEAIKLKVSNTLTFSNFYSIWLKNVEINFERTSTSTPCGLQFVSIQEPVFLEKVVINQDNCYRIISNSTQLALNLLNIENRNFTSLGAIIQMNDSIWLEILGLTISGVTFGKGTSLVSSNNQLKLVMKDTIIKECGCPSEAVQSNKDVVTSVSMITAGLIQVKRLTISDNMFCKKNMFTTISSLDNEYLELQFIDITVKNNKFQTVSESIFYSSQFYQRVLPWHSLTFLKATFEQNSLIQIESDTSDLSLAHLVLLNKIQSIKFEEVKVLNQDGFSLFLSEQSDHIVLNDIQIKNDKETFDTTPDKQTISCIIIKEFKDLNITGLQISNKKSFDTPLVYAQNNEAANTKLNIFKSNFSNLILIQNQNNLNASPIMISSPFMIDILLNETTFEDNVLKGLQNSFIYSTSAIWITNYVGIVKMQHCKFRRSISNSRYNFLYVASNTVAISNSVFSEQSFYEINKNSIVNGGCIHLSTANAEINDCEFEKSFAQIGSFIMINSFGSELFIKISRSSFKEGYALSDGGAIYINYQNSILHIICSELVFDNIYTFNDNAAVFAFSPQSQDSQKYHTLIFEGGSVQNWFGIGDNMFLKMQGMNFIMKNIMEITYSSFSSNSLAFLYYQEQQFHSQGSLIYAKSSLVKIQLCFVHDLSNQFIFAKLPLLVSATNSTVTITDFKLINSSFNRAGIEVIGGNLILSRSYFSQLKSLKLSDRFLTLSDSEIENLHKFPSEVETSFIVLHNSRLTTNETTVFNNIICDNQCNGSALSLLNSIFSISDTEINHSNAQFGGAIFIKSMVGENYIKNSVFESNSAELSGGAIYLLLTENSASPLLEINNSQFKSNSANHGRGGAVCIQSQGYTYSQFLFVRGCQVISNTAVIGASLDIQEIIPFIDSTTEIRDNKAQFYGNNIISYPSHLKVLNLEEFLLKTNATVNMRDQSNQNVDLVIPNFQSGAKLPQIEFAFVSDFEEEIIPQKEDYFNIVAQFNSESSQEFYTIRGSTDQQLNNTRFSFYDLELIGKPDTSSILEFESYDIQILNTAYGIYYYGYSFKILVNFRSCKPGEEIKSYSEFIECSSCDKGFFSFDLKPCQNCPYGAECHGGVEIETKPGFWRKGQYDDIVLLCQNLEKNCAGGSFGNNICYEGHIGALCEECDIYADFWEGNYAKSGKYSCVNCNDIQLNFLFVALLTCWTLISMTLAIKGGIEYLEHQTAAEILFSTKISGNISKQTLPNSQTNIQLLSMKDTNKINSKAYSPNDQFKQPIQINSVKEQEDKSGIYIKMLTNYIQIVSSIASFNLSIPSGIIDLPSSVGEPLQQTMNSLDCALKDIQRAIPIIYLRLIFSQIIPCFYMILFVIGLSIKYFLMKKKGKFPIYIISTGFIFLVIYVQPDLVAQSIASISCREIGGTKYILSNVAFECFTDDYNLYTTALVVPLLLLWVFILPGFLFMMLRSNKDNLSNIYVKLRYGFLYREYKQQVFYWEFIKMGVKIAIILALNFYSQSIVTKGILVFMVIVVYGVIALIKQPYEEDFINQIDVQSTNTCAISVLLGIFIYKNDFDYFVYLAFLVIILVNILYFFSMIKKIVSIYLQKFNEPISKVLLLLAKRWPCFEKFIKKVPVKKIPNKKIIRKMQSIIRQFIRFHPKQKKELIRKMILEELDQKYDNIKNPVMQEEEEKKLLNSEQIQIELTSNSERSLKNQQQLEIDDKRAVNVHDQVSKSAENILIQFSTSNSIISHENQKNDSPFDIQKNQIKFNEVNSITLQN